MLKSYLEGKICEFMANLGYTKGREGGDGTNTLPKKRIVSGKFWAEPIYIILLDKSYVKFKQKILKNFLKIYLRVLIIFKEIYINNTETKMLLKIYGGKIQIYIF